MPPAAVVRIEHVYPELTDEDFLDYFVFTDTTRGTIYGPVLAEVCLPAPLPPTSFKCL